MPDTRARSPFAVAPEGEVARTTRGDGPTASPATTRSARAESGRALWLAIAGLTIVDALWLVAVGMPVALPGALRLVVMLGALSAIAAYYTRSGRGDGIARVARSAAQLVAFSAAAEVFSYLITATGAPALDALYAAWDHALGFDWATWTARVHAHAPLAAAMGLAYASLLPQMVLCVMYLALREGADEFLWAFILSAVVTIVISGAAPAVGNLPDAPHVRHFLALRDGTFRAIDVNDLQGLISFPSYHTTLAILIAHAVRRHRLLFVAASVLNAAMVVSTLSEGGHYLVDVLAGVVVAVATMAVAPRVAAATGRAHLQPPPATR